MRLSLTIILSTFLFHAMQAQQHETSPVGEYYLAGVRETAAGFKVNADSSFEFFFSYGALDRQGHGKWRIAGNEIVFNSTGTTNDFVLESSEKTADNGILIKLTGGNPSINSFFHAELIHGGQASQAQADAQGRIQFPLQKIDSIKLFFKWSPEKSFVFPITQPDHNQFVFQVKPTILDVQFIDCTMKMSDRGFSGALPFSNGTSLDFKKSQ